MDTPALDPTARETTPTTTALDRGIDLGAVTWVAVTWVCVAAVGIALRFMQLDVWALTEGEARRSFEAFSLYRGSPLTPGDTLPTMAPLLLLLQTLGFFLFGVTDAIARIMPALLGMALIFLILGLRPFVGGPATAGMAVLAALSPTLVYASRTADPNIAVATFSLLFVIAVLRCGLPDATPGSVRRWAVLSGVALGCLFASGPNSITVLLSLATGAGLAIMLERGPDGSGAIQGAFRGFLKTPGALLGAIAALLATLVTLFTPLFSDFAAIAGIGHTFADWGRILATRVTVTPTQYFLLALLLYEILAVVFAIVAVNRTRADRRGILGWPFFGGWFAAALLLFSFSSGRVPEQTVLIALPLILLGGAALGDAVASIDWRGVFRGAGGLLFLAILGVVISAIAFLVLIGRIDGAVNEGRAIIQALIVLLLVLAPLGVAVYTLTRTERMAGRAGQPLRIALLVVAVLLGAFTLRSTVMLNFYNANEGTELLAQRTPTAAVRPMVDRLLRLSRDTTVTRGTIRDNTGSHGLAIAISPESRWPYQWYFREFPDLRVTGPVGWADASVVIAPDDVGMAEAGYTPRLYNAINRIPAAYTDPDTGGLLATIVLPTRWLDGISYLLYRELETVAAPITVSVGLDAQLTQQLFPESGPFNLFDRAGTGAGRGQFNQPRGVAVSPNGSTYYVVDAGNLRVQRFDADGGFVGIWGGPDSPTVTFATEFSQGPSGITTEGDLIFVADTWYHRVVVLDQAGRLVREYGEPGVMVNTQDAPVADIDTGRFFGPRDIAVADDEVYIVDTGNERVQVFAIDGTFLRTWGGFGSDPGQFIEPVGIVIDDERVYVADSGNGRISVFTREGEPLEQWPIPAWEGQQLFEPYLAMGPDGNIYATSSATGSVEVVAPDGTVTDSIRDINGEPLQRPIGITTSPDGVMLISDAGLNTVLRYIPPDAEPDVDVVEEFDEIEEIEDVPPTDATPAATPEPATPGATP